MERYRILKTIGDGTYGSVVKALHIQTGQVVAIKQLKNKVRSWNDCVNMREIKVLLHIDHPNVVRLLEVIKQNNKLSLVFQFLQQDLYHHIKDRSKLLSETQIRNIIFQTLQGLHHMHSKGLFHRDIKPENLLFKSGVVKIADFGLVRDLRSQPPYTQYVSTRWYRAPQVLLRSPNYGPQIDIFALGAVIAQLYTFKPLFPGCSEQDQLFKIIKIMGTPRSWQQGQQLAAQIGFRFPKQHGQSLKNQIPNASDDAIELIQAMLTYDPDRRPTALECLRHPYFSSRVSVPRNPEYTPQPPPSTRPAEIPNFTRPTNELLERKIQQDGPLARMKKARYMPGMVCK